jgi:hypothetical protein
MPAGPTISEAGPIRSLHVMAGRLGLHLMLSATGPVQWNYHDDMAPRIGRPPKYNWEQLTDGSIWKAQQGEDFKTTTSGFRSLLRYQARKRNIPVEIHSRGQIIWFQFHSGGQDI